MKKLALIMMGLILVAGCNKAKEENGAQSSNKDQQAAAENNSPIRMQCDFKGEGEHEWTKFYSASTRKPAEEKFGIGIIRDVLCTSSELMFSKSNSFDVKCYQVKKAKEDKWDEETIAIDGGKKIEHHINCPEKLKPVNFEYPGSGAKQGQYSCEFDHIYSNSEFGTKINGIKSTSRSLKEGQSFTRTEMLSLIKPYFCDDKTTYKKFVVKCELDTDFNNDEVERFEGERVDYEPELMYFRIECE